MRLRYQTGECASRPKVEVRLTGFIVSSSRYVLSEVEEKYESLTDEGNSSSMGDGSSSSSVDSRVRSSAMSVVLAARKSVGSATDFLDESASKMSLLTYRWGTETPIGCRLISSLRKNLSSETVGISRILGARSDH